MADIAAAVFAEALRAMVTEIGDDPPNPSSTWIVSNEPGSGLLGTLETLDAAAASAVPAGCTHSIAGHAGHIAFVLDLFVCAARGESPYASANWDDSWRTTRVDERAWRDLRNRLRELHRLTLEALAKGPPAVDQAIITGGVALPAHLAYHLGAVRQLAVIVKASKP
jgi:hypothetical protein